MVRPPSCEDGPLENKIYLASTVLEEGRDSPKTSAMCFDHNAPTFRFGSGLRKHGFRRAQATHSQIPAEASMCWCGASYQGVPVCGEC